MIVTFSVCWTLLVPWCSPYWRTGPDIPVGQPFFLLHLLHPHLVTIMSYFLKFHLFHIKMYDLKIFKLSNLRYCSLCAYVFFHIKTKVMHSCCVFVHFYHVLFMKQMKFPLQWINMSRKKNVLKLKQNPQFHIYSLSSMQMYR